MKTRILAALFAVSVACSAFGQSVHQIAVPDANGYPRVVDTAHPLPITGDLEIGSVTVDVFPVFSNSTGTPATATVDVNNRAIINIGSDSIGLKASVDAVKTAADSTTSAVGSAALPSNTVSTQTITLVANVSQEITSNLAAAKTREWITISAMDSEKDFWVQFGSAAAINSCRLVHEWATFPITEDVHVFVIASEAFDLFVAEGGK